MDVYNLTATKEQTISMHNNECNKFEINNKINSIFILKTFQRSTKLPNKHI